MAVIFSLCIPWNLYGKYPSFLKMRHRSITKTDWPPISSKLYIPLTAIETEDVSPKDTDEFSEDYSPEQILKQKRQIILDDFLKPRNILIASGLF